MDANEGTISKWFSAKPRAIASTEKPWYVRLILEKWLVIYDNVPDMKINQKEWKYGKDIEKQSYAFFFLFIFTHYKYLKKNEAILHD